MKIHGGFKVGLLTGCFSLSILLSESRAITSWEVLPFKVDTVVADTDTPAQKKYQPLDAKVPFKNFRYPHLDDNLNVLFISDDPVKFFEGKEWNHGIYLSRATSAGLENLVESETSKNPSGSKVFSYIRGLQCWNLDFVFNATLIGGGAGLYEYSDSRLTTVAETDQQITSLGYRQFESLGYGSITGKYILFTGTFKEGDSGLFLMDRGTRVIRQLISGKDKIPGRPEDFFAYIGLQNWITDEALAFRGDSVAKPDNNGTRGIYAYWSKGDPDFKQFAADKLTVIADPNTVIPESGGLKFLQMQSAPVGDHLVAFYGGGRDADGRELDGVYVWTPAGLRCVLDCQTVIEGVSKEPFISYNKWVTLIGRSVVFTARTESGYQAIFVYNVDRDRLALLVDTNQIIEDRKIRGFEFASHPAAGDRFAFMAQFVGGASGIYLATTPLREFGRK